MSFSELEWLDQFTVIATVTPPHTAKLPFMKGKEYEGFVDAFGDFRITGADMREHRFHTPQMMFKLNEETP